MKEKLLKNLKAKGVHATTRYNELFATYHVTNIPLNYITITEESPLDLPL